MATDSNDRQFLPVQRRHRILALLRERQSLRFDELATHLRVSAMTIRRDVAILVADGLARTVQGGVGRLPVGTSTHGQQPKGSESVVPELVAVSAVEEMTADGATIFLGFATVPTSVERAIVARKRITVVTNNLGCAATLSRLASVDLIFIGGRLDRHSSTTNGDLAARVLQELAIDVAFLTADAWHPLHGVRVSSPDQSTTFRAVIDASARSVLLGTTDTFDTESAHIFAKLSDFAAIYTDAGP